MNFILVMAFALFPMFLAYPAEAAVQTTTGAPAAAQQTIGAQPAATAQQMAPASLPARAAQARTMRAYWHVFIAFAVTWLLLFGYALTIGRRFGRLEEEVQRIRGGV